MGARPERRIAVSAVHRLRTRQSGGRPHARISRHHAAGLRVADAQRVLHRPREELPVWSARRPCADLQLAAARFFETNYCVLMTGPSATADIEGVLIHVAHGIRSLTVIAVARPGV